MISTSLKSKSILCTSSERKQNIGGKEGWFRLLSLEALAPESGRYEST